MRYKKITSPKWVNGCVYAVPGEGDFLIVKNKVIFLNDFDLEHLENINTKTPKWGSLNDLNGMAAFKVFNNISKYVKAVKEGRYIQTYPVFEAQSNRDFCSGPARLIAPSLVSRFIEDKPNEIFRIPKVTS